MMSYVDDQQRVDWEMLGRSIGAITGKDAERSERGGTTVGMNALEQILGPEFCRQAVDGYVRGEAGSEIARSVLGVLKPWSAMLRCREICEQSDREVDRGVAIELLRAVADRRVLEWIPVFLEDENEAVQGWGAGILDQLVCQEVVDGDEIGELRAAMQNHPNPGVRRYSELIEESLARIESERQ